MFVFIALVYLSNGTPPLLRSNGLTILYLIYDTTIRYRVCIHGDQRSQVVIPALIHSNASILLVNPLMLDPNATSSGTNRTQIRRLFRQPYVSIIHPAESWTPERPALSWTRVYPCVGHRVPPPGSFPTAPPHVRIVKDPLIGNGTGQTGASRDTYIMVSVLPRHPLVPPHPGFPPPFYDEYAHPLLTYTDGGLGKHDYCRFAQLYGHFWPWRGFILAPLPPTHPQFPLEQENVTTFFSFLPNPQYPIQGSWIIPRLQLLLARRAKCETDFMAAMTPAVHRRLQSDYGASLPFFDPLEIEECSSWKTFAEGRDAVGRTLRYIAEVDGLRRWMLELERQWIQGSGTHALRSDLIGVWTGTIHSQTIWSFLQWAAIPLYSLFKLPPNHPLVLRPDRGWLDNDERYRQDPIDTLVNPSNRGYERFFGKAPGTEQYPPPTAGELPREWLTWLECRTFSHPGGRVYALTPTAATFPFTTYIHLYDNVNWVWHAHDAVWRSRNKAARRAAERQRESMLSPPLYPPGYSPPPVNLNQVHPILAVLPSRRDEGNRVTHFIEETDGDCFWPVYVSRTLRQRDADWDHNYPIQISLDNGRIILHTATPWPDTTAPDDDEEHDEETQCFPIKRRYFLHEPSEEAFFKGTPMVTMASPAVIRGAQMQPGTSNSSRLGPSTFARQRPRDTPYDNDPYDINWSGDEDDFRPRRLAKAEANKALGLNPRGRFFSASTSGTIPVAGRNKWSAISSLASHIPSHNQDRPHGLGHRDDDRATQVRGCSERSRSPRRDPSRQPNRNRSCDRSLRQSTSHTPPPLRLSASGSTSRLNVESGPAISNQDSDSAAFAAVASSDEQPMQGPEPPTTPVPWQPQILAGSALWGDQSVGSDPPPGDVPGEETCITASEGESWLEDLCYHRRWMHDYFKFRLFYPLLPAALASAQVVHAVFDQGIFCYPVRISNITSPLSISAMLQVAELNRWGDIVAISAHEEPDSTISMDLGFRFVEDALMMWNRVGVDDEDRRWVAEAVCGVVGLVTFLKVPETPPRPPADRLHCLNLCAQLEQRLPVRLRDQRRLEMLKELSDQLCAQVPSSADATSAPQSDTITLITRLEDAGVLWGFKWPTTLSQEVAPETQVAPPIWIGPSENRWSPGSLANLLSFCNSIAPLLQASLPSSSTQPGPSSPSSQIKRPNKHQVPPQRTEAGGAKPDVAAPMNARERDLLLRTMNRRANAKYAAWNSPHVPLPSIPPTDLIEPSPKKSNKLLRREETQARGVKVPLPVAKPSGFGFVHRFFRLWDWYDQCLERVKLARELLDQECRLPGIPIGNEAVDPEDQARIHNLVCDSLSNMEAAFAISTRMLNVYGQEYAEIEAGLAKRRAISNRPH